jgi:biopolymer transport protein ExbB/TolQ
MDTAMVVDLARQALWMTMLISAPLLLVALVVGLIVGIIAFVSYNTLVGRIGKVIHKMEARAVEFIDILEQPTN